MVVCAWKPSFCKENNVCHLRWFFLTNFLVFTSGYWTLGGIEAEHIFNRSYSWQIGFQRCSTHCNQWRSIFCIWGCSLSGTVHPVYLTDISPWHFWTTIHFLKIMLCFSRDTQISQLIYTEFVNTSKSKQYEGPPSGIVPFHGICMFGTWIIIWHNWIELNYFSNFHKLQLLHFPIFSIHQSSFTSLFEPFTFVIAIDWPQ